jgi:hypothetical protein
MISEEIEEALNGIGWHRMAADKTLWGKTGDYPAGTLVCLIPDNVMEELVDEIYNAGYNDCGAGN